MIHVRETKRKGVQNKSNQQ